MYERKSVEEIIAEIEYLADDMLIIYDEKMDKIMHGYINDVINVMSYAIYNLMPAKKENIRLNLFGDKIIEIKVFMNGFEG